MQFESLKVFCDIARHRSFSQAASANEVTQSAASQIVRQLEKRLGVRLVDRSTRPLVLTPEGQMYYDGCKDLVERYIEVEAAVRKLHSEIAATVQVAAIYSVGLSDMSQYVERFNRRFPRAEIHIDYLHPDRVYERVRGGTADLGLVSFPRRSRDLVALPWREEEMVLVCAPSHRLASQKTLRPKQLEGERYVGFDRELDIRREVDRYLREHGVTVDVVLEFDNIENIKKAVEISVGVALLPLPTLRREIQAGSLAAVPLGPAKLFRPLAIIHRRHHLPNSTALRFVELLKQPSDGVRRRRLSGMFAAGTQTHASGNGSHKSNGKTRQKRT